MAPLAQTLESVTDQDIEQISHLLSSGFQPHLRHLGLKDDQRLNFVKAFVTDDMSQSRNTFGIIRNQDTQVIDAVCHLVVPNGEPNSPYVELPKFRQQLSLLTRIRLSKFEAIRVDESGIGKKEAYVQFLAVSEDCRGQGLGKLLLEWADRQAQAKGMTKISLHVASANPARRLYKRHGYKYNFLKSNDFLAAPICWFLAGDLGYKYVTKTF